VEVVVDFAPGVDFFLPLDAVFEAPFFTGAFFFTGVAPSALQASRIIASIAAQVNTFLIRILPV
jgi:hypothetical protein